MPLTNLIRTVSPFPTIGEGGDLRSGLAISQSPTCGSCKRRECASAVVTGGLSPVAHEQCWRGLSFVRMKWPFGEITCNGLIVRDRTRLDNKELRRRNRGQRVGWQSLIDFHTSAAALDRYLRQVSDARVNEAIDSLHDVRTAVSLVTRNAESIVAGLPGASDDEKIEGAAPGLKSLLKSVRLLQTRLSMSSLLANPESARYGNKRSTPIYKLCHRMTMLFREEAAGREVTLRMQGTSHAQRQCYDSFETIPLVLIDNAIKYSVRGSVVDVRVQDCPSGTRVSVESYGPTISSDEQEEIFDKGYRTASARQFASGGSGLGLYLATIVARAHGFEIEYTQQATGVDSRYGSNVFTFVVA